MSNTAVEDLRPFLWGFFSAFPQYIVRGGYVYGFYCFQVVKVHVIVFIVSVVCLPFPFVFPSSSLPALITIIRMTVLFQKYPLITRYGIKSEAGGFTLHILGGSGFQRMYRSDELLLFVVLADPCELSVSLKAITMYQLLCFFLSS